MSAIKTHELFNIVQGDTITVEDEEGEQILNVKSLLISRQKPHICQIFTERENAGSMNRGTQVYHAKIETIEPGATSTDFSVKAKVGDEFHKLSLKTVRSESSECIIS
jgi:hypothetical protein